MARNWLLLLPWLGSFALLGALAYWLYRKRKSRASRSMTGPALEVAQPAHEIAYAALNRLEASGLLEKGEIKVYFTEVSEILRRYFEDRYHVDALEMASHEVVESLAQVDVAFDTRLECERFLGDCDLVKFAKWIPGMEACRDIVPRARGIVDQTKSVAEAAAGTREGREAGASSEDSAAPAALPGGREGSD
jgi:hypothetical protein